MPKTHVEHADFATTENSNEAIIEGLPEGLSLLEKMPIFYARFRFEQTDLAHNPKDQQRRKPSRDSLRIIEKGEHEPGKNLLEKLAYSVRMALKQLRGATPKQADKVASWLVRGSPLKKRAIPRPLNEKASNALEQKPNELPKPSQAIGSPGEVETPPATRQGGSMLTCAQLAQDPSTPDHLLALAKVLARQLNPDPLSELIEEARASQEEAEEAWRRAQFPARRLAMVASRGGQAGDEFLRRAQVQEFARELGLPPLTMRATRWAI